MREAEVVRNKPEGVTAKQGCYTNIGQEFPRRLTVSSSDRLRVGESMSSLSRSLTALSGEYFVAAHLSMNGIVASLTLKNYPGVDIFAYNPATEKHAAVQVKTTRVAKSSGYWISNPDRVKSEGTPFVFVHLSKKAPPEFYPVDAAALADLIRSEGKYWYVTLRDLEAYKDQWHNLGLD